MVKLHSVCFIMFISNGGRSLPKGPEDYMDINLSKLYELEGQRQKMSELAEERIKKGESLASPELLKESSDFNQLMVDEAMLEQMATQLEKDEEKKAVIKTNKMTDDKTTDEDGNMEHHGENDAKEGE